MDAEDVDEDEAAETEVNSNMLSNLLPDQQRLITADFFQQAMLAAVAGNSGYGGAVASAAVVTEVSCCTKIPITFENSENTGSYLELYWSSGKLTDRMTLSRNCDNGLRL